MANELTFSIIKPNAMKKNVVGKIIDKFESADLQVAAIKLMQIDKALAEEFYAEHKERPFFGELVSFMTSAPVVVMALYGENAITKNREIMGATNPADAADGTIRKLFGDSVGENAVHGSDSPESAKREVNLFFDSSEVLRA